MKKISKRLKEAHKEIEKGKTYSISEAILKIKKLPKVKFDESLDLAISLSIDPKKTDQLVRGTVVLPHGTGKKRRVLVFCKGEAEAAAKEAGADLVGAAELIEKVAKGFLDFDCVVATPEMMKDVSRLGRVLGPRGLMPSPKTGTVTNDIKGIIKELKAGKIEFRVNKQGGLHVTIGKASFPESSLENNFKVFFDALNQARPNTLKGQFIKSLFISTSMGPGFRLKV
ncbi:MAG: 50S ribosomal protein L1 [Candidatus Omnitrophica bacterium]|nr:50S ribosomal protein L1 [Candidatus Omnitrophota bacterium]